MGRSIEALRIVFLGTPDFAVTSLDALVKSGANIVAVVTAPDKPAGRGMQLQSSPVKKYALQEGIPVLQPERLKHPEFVQQLRSLEADLQVVVAFRMLPEIVWNMPSMGTINVHGSLLPQYRGAAPINWAVMNGELHTGVTTFKLQHEIDTGDILLQEQVIIQEDDTAGTLHDKLMVAGADLLVTTVKGLAAGTLKEVPQQQPAEGVFKHAPKIFREDTQINWHQPVQAVHNHIRGLSPYPAAFTLLKEKQVKVFSVHTETPATGVSPGTFETDHKQYLRFAATDGWVYIDELQQEGKKRMSVIDFLRGFR